MTEIDKLAAAQAFAAAYFEASEERDRLARRVEQLETVLRDIASADYRGYRSWESTRAYRALQEETA